MTRHLKVTPDKQSNGAWLSDEFGRNIGFIHDAQDAMALVAAYNAMWAATRPSVAPTSPPVVESADVPQSACRPL